MKEGAKEGGKEREAAGQQEENFVREERREGERGKEIGGRKKGRRNIGKDKRQKEREGNSMRTEG